jgi:hypothetical protein
MSQENEVQQGTTTSDPLANTTGVVPATDVAPKAATDVTTPANAPANPAQPSKAEQGGQENWQAKFEQLERSYKEATRKLSTQGAEKNQYRAQLDGMNKQLQDVHKALQAMSKKPFEFGQFLEDLQARGPQALFDSIQEPLTAELSKFKTENEQLAAQVQSIQIERAVEIARANSKKYPDFDKYEAEMTEAFLNGSLPMDTSKMSPAEIVDKLYSLVRLNHSEDHFKAAEQLGKIKKEKELAREAQASVAGGGKPITPAIKNPNDMTAAELRAKLGVADRD